MKLKKLCQLVGVILVAYGLTACTASAAQQATATPVSVSSTATPTSEKLITLATLEWPPYVGEELEDYGFTSEIVTASFERMGYEVKIEFMPWARVLQEVEQGHYDAGFPAYYSEERANTYFLTDAFVEGPVVFYKQAGENITYTTLEDLKPYRIGVVLGYVNTPEFDAADYLQKDAANNDEQNLKKLLLNRLDLVVIDRFVAASIIDQSIPEAKDSLDFLSPPLEVKTLHVILSRNTENAEQKLKDFHEGLQQIIADGTFAQIMEKHGMD